MQVTYLAIEFHLSYQKLREYQLIQYFSLFAEFFRGFFVIISLLPDEYTGIISQFLKGDVATLLSFEKLGECSIGF